MFHRFFAGVAFAALLAAAAPSAEAAFSPDTVIFTTSGVQNISGSPASIGDVLTIFGKTTISGLFDHQIVFSVDGSATAQGTATANLLLTKGSSISDLAYRIYETGSPGGAFVSASSAAVLAGLSANTSYTFEIRGVRTAGFSVGNYTGNLEITPIPGALLLLGPALGGLAFVARRA